MIGFGVAMAVMMTARLVGALAASVLTLSACTGAAFQYFTGQHRKVICQCTTDDQIQPGEVVPFARPSATPK